MTKRDFSFIPDKLEGDANRVADYYQVHGYTVKVDHVLPSAPYVPTLYAKRDSTQIVIIIGSVIAIDQLTNWCAYAKSTGKDFRVLWAVPENVKIRTAEENFIRNESVGLLKIVAGEVIESIAAKDLALAVRLPTIQSLPAGARRHLGSAYEQFSRSQWREGFEDACQSLENLAREYLIQEIRGGRVTQFIKKKGPVPADERKVGKMTLGNLSHAFTEIPNQTQKDSQLAKILGGINDDRVGVVHKKKHKRTEGNLRKNVGMHMWSIISGIKLLC